jgi:oligopeptide transport system substrate-binding protein
VNRLGIALTTASLLALSACTSITPEGGADGSPPPPPHVAEPQPPGVLYVYARQPTAIDPAWAVETDDFLIVRQLFESLTRVGDGLAVEPAAAQSWEANEDATVFTFTLREDATFHDGSRVTADDFVRAWQRIADRTNGVSPSHHLLDVVMGIEDARAGQRLAGVVAVDELTLEVTLSTPYADLPALVSHPALAPVPRAALDRADFDRTPVGNGPFRMSEPWQPGQFIRVEPHTGHPSAPTDLDQVVFRIYGGDDAVERGFEDFHRGYLDLAPIPDGAYRDAVREFGRSTDGFRGPGVIDGLRTTVVFYGFNVETPPFDDPAVRRALALLIDREQVIDPPGRVPATSIVPPVFAAYRSPECRFCSVDGDAARQILEEHEIELDPIELVFYDTPEHAAVAEAVAAGIDRALGEGTLLLRPLSQEEWVTAIRNGEAGFFLSGWVGEYPSPGAYLDPLFLGSDNLTGFADPEVRELLEAARRESDPEVRLGLYAEAEAIVLHEMPVIPLTFYQHARVVSERTHGLVFDPFGGVDLTRVVLVGTE